MEVVSTRRFDAAYDKLGRADKQAVQKAVAIPSENLRQPGLRVRKMATAENTWEASPSRRLRITFEIAEGTIFLHNVGGHEVLKRP